MEEIGERLRAAREARGITLEQAEEETKIRRKYIEALESGTKSDLPGEVYLKGFLRTYGNYLGLDGPSLVEEYKLAVAPRRPAAAVGATAAAAAPDVSPAFEAGESPRERARQLVERERPQRSVTRPAERAEPKPAVIRSGTSTLYTRADGTPRPRRESSGPQLRGIVAILLAVVLVGGVGYLGWKVVGHLGKGTPAASGQQPAPTKPADPAPAPPTTPPAPVPEPVKVTMTKGEGDQVLFAVNAKEITVRLEATERVWVQAMADDQLVYDNFPVAPQEFHGAKLRIRVGHMVGVTLYVNGQKFDTGLKQGPYTLIFSGQS